MLLSLTLTAAPDSLPPPCELKPLEMDFRGRGSSVGHVFNDTRLFAWQVGKIAGKMAGRWARVAN